MIELLVGHLLMKVGDEDSSGAIDLDIEECLSFDYQPREGSLGFRLRPRRQRGIALGPSST